MDETPNGPPRGVADQLRAVQITPPILFVPSGLMRARTIYKGELLLSISLSLELPLL